MFVGLTKLQQHVALAKLHGENKREAYREGGGKATGESALDSGITEILKNPKVYEFIVSMSEIVVERILCTTEDVVRGLMKEAMLNGKDGDKPDETTPASRVSSLKALSDYTGGFDNNVRKVEASDNLTPWGNIEAGIDEPDNA